MRLNPEPEPVTVVVIEMFLAFAREAGPRQPRLWIFQLGLNPKEIGKGNGNGLGLGKTPQCAITGNPSN
ncbi:MAG: hypothetical protein DRJ65_17115 [Acidobacteria bacterium]|nr:MAG: hypothetical protein DRJ65_17115 [Acidobacteriota bacterium]